ncbi:MAG: hypothetical protein QXY05_01430 [Candidatus Anstonellales archaeon]
MDVGKAFGAARPALLLIFLLAIVRSVGLFLSSSISEIEVFGELFESVFVCVVVPVILIINVLIYLWLGQLVCKAKLGMLDAAVVGGLTGAIDGIITGAIFTIATLLGVRTMGGVTTGTIGTVFYGLGVGFIATILLVVLLLFVGLVLSVIGYMMSQGIKNKK